MQLSEQELVRRDKLGKLRELGIDPYPAALYPIDANSKSIAFLAPEAKPLTYGNMLKFIRGDGDLRRVGAEEGFTGRFAFISQYWLTKSFPLTLPVPSQSHTWRHSLS